MKKKSTVKKHFDNIAPHYDFYKKRHRFYYNNLKKLLSSLIPKNANVFEVGCGTGDLIAHLKPAYGKGFDISGEMIERAKRKYVKNKNLRFSTKLPVQKFEYIFMSDVIEHLEKPEATFIKISELMDKNSLFICTMANPIWEPVLMVAEKLKFKMPEGEHKRIDFYDIKKKLRKAGLTVRSHDYDLLIPVDIPVITYLANKYLKGMLKKYSFIEYFTATRL